MKHEKVAFLGFKWRISNNHFAESIAFALDKKSEHFYEKVRDTGEVSFDIYKGAQKYYPKNLIVVSWQNGSLFINEEIKNTVSMRNKDDIDYKLLFSGINPEQIIYDKKTELFPFRRLLGMGLQAKNTEVKSNDKMF